jgi:YD repeat-containing protein
MARLLLILLILASLLTALPTAAQDMPPAVESQNCARVEALMNIGVQTGSKPDQLVRGGGTIHDSTPVQASITADDAGDRWAWGAVNTKANGMSQITLDSDVPLTVRAFKGLSPISLLQDNVQVTEANLAPGVQTVSALLAGDGYYTLLVRRQNLADTSQTGSYTLTIGANVAGGVAFAPVDWRGQQALAAQRELIPPDGDGIITFSPEPGGAITLRVPADALRSIQVERSIVVEFATRGRLSWVREDVRELAMLDGSLNVYLNNGGFVYIENYSGAGSDTITDEFNNFTLQDDGRSARGIDWNTVQNLWLLDGCLGIELRETGQRFIAEGETLNVTAYAAPSGSTGQTFAVAGGPATYNLSVDWLDIQRIIASGRGIEAFLTNDRSLLIDRLNAAISQPPNAPFSITESNGSVTLLSTDWLNTRRIEIEGDALRVTVDDLRNVVNRSGRVLRTLETRGAAMRAFWQDGSQTLLLPESGDFIEIDTPAALPAYESSLRPRQINEATGAFGYLPTNLNNAGQECYPVNTVFDFNCAANGEVNPANGGLSLAVTDLHARGARLDLTLSRTYNSHNALVDGPFGRGWSTDYLLDYAVDYAAGQQARRVTPNMEYPVGLDVTYAPLGLVIYTTASGSRHAFELDDDGWHSGTMPGWFIALRANPLADDWHLARDDGTIYDFDLAGRLKAIRHVYGSALQVTREDFTLTDPNAVTTYTIADGTGRSIVLTFDANRHITRSELYDGDVLLDSADYDYNAAGLLVGVQYGDGASASYTYNESGLLNFHEDPRAPLAQILHYGYDEAGRVLWSDISPAVTLDQCGGAAAPRPFRCYRYESTNNQFTTTVTDEWGRTTVWTYSVSNDRTNAYRLMSHTGPDGMATTYSYGSGELARFPVNFSRGGLQHQLRWEPFGQLTAFQSDAWIGFSATYNTGVRLDINGDGAPEYTLPLLASYRSDGDRGPTQPVTYAYDPATGLPVSLTESSGLITRIDARAGSFNLPTVLTVTGGETVTSSTLTYDDYGFPVTRQDVTGVDQYVWDGFGRPIHFERQDGLGGVLVSYDITYNPTGDGRCTIITDPLGTQTAACYDFRGRLVEQTMTDSGGSVLEQTSYAYDTFDRLIRTVSRTGDEPVTTAYAYTTEGVSAPGNRRVIETLPDGTHRITEYDAAERVVAVQNTTGLVTTYTYPPATASTETVIQRDPGGAETTYEYNRARQLTRLDYGPVEWGLLYGGSRASAQREPSQIILNSGQGASTTIDFDTYDSAGRLTQVSFKIRRPDDNNPNAEPVRSDNSRADMTLRYSYDSQGRLLAIENPVTGDATHFNYANGEGGRRIVQVDNGQPLTYTYDALNRLLSVESAEGSVTYAYNYDTKRGLLDVNVAFLSADGTQQDWLLSYDSTGNLREWRDEEGRLTRYEYDQRSRLVRVFYVDDEDEIPIAEYEYNTADQVTAIINRDGQEARYVYNARGQLTTRRDFDGVVTAFIYDPQGNVQAVSDGLGFTTTYTYDSRNRLATITDPLGRQIRYDWQLSNISELNVSSDLLGQTRYLFDLYDRLWQIRDAQDGQHLLRYDFGGRVSEWRKADGALTLGFSYGPNGALAGVNGPENWDWAYAYNNLGQIITRTDPDGASLQLNFDRLGQLTGLAAPGGDFERLYDRSEPGLIAVTQGDGTIRYGYDVYGRLIEETRDEATTEYEYRDDGFTRFTPDGAVTDYIYTGVLGDVEVPYLITEDYSPEGDLFRVRNYRYTQRGQLVGIEQEDYFPDSDVPYITEERIDYDAEGRPIRYIDAENNLYAWSYDLAGRLNTTQYPDGGIYSYTYDRLNRLTGLGNPTGQQLRLTYDALGHLTGVALNNATLENYTYSPLGWLLTRAFADYPDGAGQISYRYSPGGLPLGWSIGSSTVTLERAPDALHRLIRVSDGGNVDYTYDSAGNLTGAGDQTYAYDSLGRLAGVDWAGGIVTYAYSVDEDGSTLAINLPDGQTLNVMLDHFRHIRRVEANGQIIDVEYELLDGDDLEARMTWAERYTAQVRFNRLGHILLLQYQDEAESRRLQRFAYTDNYAGIPLAIDDRENDILLGYDNVYRPLTTSWLVTAGLRPTDSVDYAFTLGYDTQGNRVRELRQSIDGSVTEVFYDYDATGTLLRSRTIGAAVATSGLGILGVLMLALRRNRRVRLPVLLAMLVGGWWIVQAQNTPAFEYTYNDAGHVETIADHSDPAAPVTTSFAYDGFGRLVTITVGEDSTALEYDALGRLIATETAESRTEYRYNGQQLVSIIEGGTTWVAVGVLDGQYLLLTDGTDSRWTLYDALGAVRQSFVNEPGGESDITNRFDILGRVLDGVPAPGTPLVLPLFRGMLYDAAHGLYIGLDGRAYDPATGRYLQRSLTGPDAAGNLYNLVLQPANPPVQVFDHDPLVEPLALLAEHAHLLDAPTARSVYANHLPDLYAGWQDDGLQALNDFQMAQMLRFTNMAQGAYTLIYAYNRAGILPDAGGNLHLFDTANSAAPVYAQPPLTLPQVNELPPVSLRWTPQVQTTEIVPAHWFNSTAWRGLPNWSLEAPQPLFGERAPGTITPVLPLPLSDMTDYADLFRALDDLPVAAAEDWIAEIDAGVLPTRPFVAPENAQAWLRRWFTDDTLPVWAQFRALHDLPDAPGAEAATLNLR